MIGTPFGYLASIFWELCENMKLVLEKLQRYKIQIQRKKSGFWNSKVSVAYSFTQKYLKQCLSQTIYFWWGSSNEEGNVKYVVLLVKSLFKFSSIEF